MSEQREGHTPEPEDLEVGADEAADVKGGDAVISPRDSASGQPTGKVKPAGFNFTHHYDQSSTNLS